MLHTKSSANSRRVQITLHVRITKRTGSQRVEWVDVHGKTFDRCRMYRVTNSVRCNIVQTPRNTTISSWRIAYLVFEGVVSFLVWLDQWECDWNILTCSNTNIRDHLLVYEISYLCLLTLECWMVFECALVFERFSKNINIEWHKSVILVVEVMISCKQEKVMGLKFSHFALEHNTIYIHVFVNRSDLFS